MWTVVLRIDDQTGVFRGITEGSCKLWAIGSASLTLGKTVRDLDALRKLEETEGYLIQCDFYVGDIGELTKANVQ